jgi:two-component system, OmpR family, sensor kinase
VKSIRTQLLVWLIISLGGASLLAGYGIFRSARQEANELFDYELQTVARSLPQSLADEKLADPDSPGYDGLNDDRLAIQSWSTANIQTYQSEADAHLPRQSPGFQTIEIGDKHWRTFGLRHPAGYVQVAQPMWVRDKLALKLASRSLSPLAAIVPLEIVLVLIVVRRAIRPLNKLSRSLAQRSIDTLAPLHFDEAVQSEVKPVIEAMNDLLARLDTALQAQRVFVADAAHELRTPLTALKLQIQVAQGDKSARHDSELLRKLGERVNRAIHLVQQLLTLAREDANTDRPWERVDLRTVVVKVIAELSVLAEQKHIDLGFDCASLAEANEPVYVMGDSNSLSTMVSTLVDNAIRYVPSYGQVDVRLDGNLKEVCLEVIDNGPGIPEAELHRVLDRFYRAENTSGQGSGLGLAIAAKIATKHHAVLSVKNRAHGQGLIVRVSAIRCMAARQA